MTTPKKDPYHQRSDEQRIVVTGMGAITPLGNDVNSTWNNLIAGKSGVTRIEHFDEIKFDINDFRTQIAATVKNLNVKDFLNIKDVRRFDSFIHYAQIASAMALQQAGFIDSIHGDSLPVQGVDADRFSVVIGSGIGGIRTIEESYQTLIEQGAKKVSPFIIPGAIINMSSGLIAIRHGLKGANFGTVSACATSAHAIGVGARLIACGDADVVLVGGSEKASTPLGMAGFASMHALSTRNDEPSRASRPFDIDRDGFVLGDGAGVLVIESLAHAKKRGATIFAELIGLGMSDDAHHITSPLSEGKGAAKAMQNAINDAGIDAREIGYINAHGTSTPAGDIAESHAIESIFNKYKDSLLVSSTKSMTGHLLGAAGSVEAIFTCLALQNQIIPPTINLDNQDPKCTLDYVPHTARKVTNLNYAMSNGFGFGGTNCTLLFARWQNT